MALVHSYIDAALSHNNLLSDNEQRSIHALISDHEKDLGCIDSEIARVETQLDQLRSQRKTVADKIRTLLPAIAPHRKLPNEILAEVFMHSAPKQVSILGGTQRSVPYSILRVCSRWKDIALQIRQLWTNLAANLDMHPNLDVCDFAQRADIILSRSQPSTISLDISYCEGNSNAQAMRDLIVRSESRVKKLTLRIAPSSLPLLYDISSAFFGRLEDVSMILNSLPMKAIVAFQAARMLRQFSLAIPDDSEMDLLWSLNVLPLPWAQLTVLHFSDMIGIYPSEAHTIFRQCRALISCSITIATEDDISEMRRTPSPTVLPTLRRLKLTIYDDSNPCLQDFDFPGLITLQLHFELFNFQKGAWEADFHPFICRLLKLQSLHLFAPVTYDTALQDILQDVPLLTSFTYFDHPLDEEILAMIANGNLLPRLKSLSCRVIALGEGLHVLERRLNDTNVTTIQDSTIHYYLLHGGAKEKAEALRNAGLRIST